MTMTIEDICFLYGLAILFMLGLWLAHSVRKD